MAKALTQIAGGGLVESKWQPRATTEQMGETGGAGEASYRARGSKAHRVHVAADHLTHK